MYDDVKTIAGVLPDMEEDFKQEFEARIAQTGTLAFRVAFAVLRKSEDAEEVAQEAFAKAYRRFGQLRDPDRFRAWLVENNLAHVDQSSAFGAQAPRAGKRR